VLLHGIIFFGVILLMVGDVLVDSDTSKVALSISKIYRLGLSELLIGVVLRAYIHMCECACEHLHLYFV
jgi:hypothetical protein